jgi:protein-S-isoprenylcysteine O-methyltransferase Ste14
MERVFCLFGAQGSLAAVSVVLAALAVPSGSSGISSGEQEDRGNRWVFGAISLIALLMAFFPSCTDRIGLRILLRSHFGGEYDGYFARTWRWLPEID